MDSVKWSKEISNGLNDINISTEHLASSINDITEFMVKTTERSKSTSFKANKSKEGNIQITK
ncbi:hypothetical protein KHA80_07195 [Anaerobacillus sp. HL2]|nr:hypothetical protein KHA80_07195 [Anaerobacillus sp. HL2]